MGTLYISENGRVCRFRYLPRYCNAHKMYCITPAQNQESARLILRGSRASPCCFSAPNQRRSFFLENLEYAQNLTVDIKRTKRQIMKLPVTEAPVTAPLGPACSQFILYTWHH